MFRLIRRLPFFRLYAIAQTVLLARRHFQQLSPADRRRLAELVRRGRGMNQGERDELRRLLAKLEPRAFLAAAAQAFSPIGGFRSFGGRRGR
jgi:hypothetical protein